jgi:predicted RNA-binding Zn-ribbon protein involved in translation (DUF1610 family)
MPLRPEVQREAVTRITGWRLDPDKPVHCPACQRPGLSIIDRSARPHTEWYALACPACGLNETLAVALGSVPPGLD